MIICLQGFPEGALSRVKEMLDQFQGSEYCAEADGFSPQHSPSFASVFEQRLTVIELYHLLRELA